MLPYTLLHPNGYLRRGKFGWYIQCPNCPNTRHLDEFKPIWTLNVRSGHLYCPSCSRTLTHLDLELIPTASFMAVNVRNSTNFSASHDWPEGCY